MSLRKRLLVSAAACAFALCLSAIQAKAERATFSLPQEVHWGNVTLEQGKHVVTLERALSLPRMISVNEKQGPGWIIALTEQSRDEGSESYLKLVNIGGEQFVREFYSAATGKKLTFSVPGGYWPGKHGSLSQRLTLHN